MVGWYYCSQWDFPHARVEGDGARVLDEGVDFVSDRRVLREVGYIGMMAWGEDRMF